MYYHVYYYLQTGMTNEEARKCVKVIRTETSSSTYGAVTKKKNWAAIFKQCGFSEMEAQLSEIRRMKSSSHSQQGRGGSLPEVVVVRDKDDLQRFVSSEDDSSKNTSDSSSSSSSSKLINRVLHAIHRLLIETMTLDGMIATSVVEDQLLLAEMEALLNKPTPTRSHRVGSDDDDRVGSDDDGDSLSSGSGSTRASILHQFLILKYRIQRKLLMLSLSKHYGLDLSSIFMQPINDDESAVELVGQFKSKSLITLAEKVQRFNEWFQRLDPSHLHVTAAVIPDYRIGVLTTADVYKGDVYLGRADAAILSMLMLHYDMTSFI
jgi:hypothetical protein